MKIGRQGNAASAISTANAETIVVRGHDLCEELIGAVTLKNVTSRFAMEKIKSVTALPVPAA